MGKQTNKPPQKSLENRGWGRNWKQKNPPTPNENTYVYLFKCAYGEEDIKYKVRWNNKILAQNKEENLFHFNRGEKKRVELYIIKLKELLSNYLFFQWNRRQDQRLICRGAGEGEDVLLRVIDIVLNTTWKESLLTRINTAVLPGSCRCLTKIREVSLWWIYLEHCDFSLEISMSWQMQRR